MVGIVACSIFNQISSRLFEKSLRIPYAESGKRLYNIVGWLTLIVVSSSLQTKRHVITNSSNWESLGFFFRSQEYNITIILCKTFDERVPHHLVCRISSNTSLSVCAVVAKDHKNPTPIENGFMHFVCFFRSCSDC
jgi:hypothetical protein